MTKRWLVKLPRRPLYTSVAHILRKPPQKRNLANDITKEQRDQGIAEIAIYQEWITKHILPQGRTDGSPAPIMILPLGRPGANYRDIVPKPG